MSEGPPVLCSCSNREQEERDQLRSMGVQWGDGEGRLRANPEHGPF